MSNNQRQNIIDIQNIVNNLGESEIQKARELLEKLLDSTLMQLIPGIDDLDKMNIDKKIKLIKLYSLPSEKRNQISYTEIYNKETLKVMEESEKGLNLSEAYDNIEELFKELEE